MKMKHWSMVPMAALLMVAGWATRAWADSEVVDTKALQVAAKMTQDRISKEGCSWTTAMTLRNGAVLEVERMEKGANSLYRVAVNYRGQREALEEVIATNGIWYVTQKDRKEKCRPYEAIFHGPADYLWIELAKIEVFQGEPATLTRKGDDLAVAKVPVGEPFRQQAAAIVKQFHAVDAAHPGSNSISPETRESMAQLEDMLKNGLERRYDLKTGMLIYSASPKMVVTVQGFRLLTPADAKSFEVNDKDYVDRTAPLPGNKADWVMFGYLGAWTPGHPVGDLDLVILDTKSGEFRRVPYQGAAASAGCFTVNRGRVIVSGANVENGVMSIVEVDLKSGANRPLGGKLAASGLNMFPKLSGDGTLLGFMHRDLGDGTLDSRQVAINMATGKEQLIGGARDYGVPSWASGNVLVLPVRAEVDLTKPGEGDKIPASTICKLDLQGKLTGLVKGTMCEVVGAGDTVLFEDDDVWKLCDLDGKNVRPLSDSAARYAFPAPSPDGKRVLMMRYEQGKAPVPVIVGVADGKVEEVKVGGGFWGMPAWR